MNGNQFWLCVAALAIIAYGWYRHEMSKKMSIIDRKLRRFNKRVGKSIDHLSPLHRALMFVRDEYGIGISHYNEGNLENYHCYLPKEWALNATLSYRPYVRQFVAEELRPKEYNQYHIKEVEFIAAYLNRAIEQETLYRKTVKATSFLPSVIVLFITLWLGSTPNI